MGDIIIAIVGYGVSLLFAATGVYCFTRCEKAEITLAAFGFSVAIAVVTKLLLMI